MSDIRETSRIGESLPKETGLTYARVESKNPRCKFTQCPRRGRIWRSNAELIACRCEAVLRAGNVMSDSEIEELRVEAFLRPC